MSALCLSHSHSAADMETLVPASPASSGNAPSCMTTTTSFSASNSSSLPSSGKGECLQEPGICNPPHPPATYPLPLSAVHLTSC